MSCIFGIIDNKQDSIYIKNNSLLSMQTALNHWNADDLGLWSDNQTGLGHLMLYNTPESLNEKLPYHSIESKLTITADARIDNRDELYGRLNIPEALQNTIPDSTIILKAYEQYGTDCVKYLIGDFAFAIWDESKQELFCARDHLGVKPFFYYSDNGTFIFASEKKGILALPDVDRSINKQFFYNQLGPRVEQDVDTTLYQKIKRLPPAHILMISGGGQILKLTRYWDLDTETEINLPSKEAYYEQLLHLFNQAVKCRTRSAFAVGAELSGGLDSSAITGAANNFLRADNKELFTLSNTLPDGVADDKLTKLDERKYMDAVIEFNNITNAIYLTETVFKDEIEEADFSIFVNDGVERWDPLWQLPQKKAALDHNIRTLLSGFPGDEMVTYRGKFHFLDYRDKNQYLKYFLTKRKHKDISKLEPLMPYALRYAFHRLKTALKLYDPHTSAAYEQFNIPDEYKRNRTEGRWQDINYKAQFKSYRHTQKYRILKAQVNHRLESETRYGIHFKTEPRFPMADIRLVQFYLSMPNYLKYDGELSRTTYRQAVKDYLPPLILERDSKQGSIAPFLSLNKRNWQRIIQLVTDITHPSLFKNKEVVLAALKNLAETGSIDKPIGALPAKEMLRWLGKNPQNIHGL